jgi:hypothetical protein
MRWVKRLIAVAVLSMSTALAGVGAGYEPPMFAQAAAAPIRYAAGQPVTNGRGILVAPELARKSGT